MTGVSSAKRLAIWLAIAHTYTAMIAIIMDMWQWTVQTRYHHQAHQPCHRTNNRDWNRRPSSSQPSHTRRLHHDHRDRSRLSRSCSHPSNHSYWSSSHHEHHRNCSRSSHRYSHHSSLHNRSSSWHRYHRDTLHTRSSHPNTSRDDSRSRHNTKHHHYKPAQGSSSTKYENKSQKPKQVSIDDPLSDYYSLEESESNSEDDLN